MIDLATGIRRDISPPPPKITHFVRMYVQNLKSKIGAHENKFAQSTEEIRLLNVKLDTQDREHALQVR